MPSAGYGVGAMPCNSIELLLTSSAAYFKTAVKGASSGTLNLQVCE